MNKTILRAFESAPAEAAIIGRILAGYGELEFEFCQCLASALGGTMTDTRAAIRALFRVKGETSRLEIGDALMRHKYADADLGDAYNEMIGAVRRCKTIRNQFAHCHWLYEHGKGLFFTTVDKPAKTVMGECHSPSVMLEKRY